VLGVSVWRIAHSFGLIVVILTMGCDTRLPEPPRPGAPRPRPMKAADHLAGLVVDEFGNRLADAATWHLGSPSAKTDGQGRFTIPLTDNQRSWAGDKYVVRVSLPGFRPRTRAVAPERSSPL